MGVDLVAERINVRTGEGPGYARTSRVSTNAGVVRVTRTNIPSVIPVIYRVTGIFGFHGTLQLGYKLHILPGGIAG